MGKKIKINFHCLVPKQVKLSDAEKKKLLEKYRLTAKELPKILKTDPALAELKVKAGDVIKIIRTSKTAGESTYYRGVINE